MTFLKELRDAAMTERSAGLRADLRKVADRIAECITELEDKPDDTRLIRLNSQWSYAKRLLERSGRDDPGSNGGAVALNEQQRMAA